MIINEKIISVLVVALLVLFSACNKMPREENYRKEPNLSFSYGTLVIKSFGDIDSADFDSMDNKNEVETIEIYLNESAKAVKLPEFPNVRNINVEIEGELKVLDISALENLKEFTLLGKTEELILPKNTESISTYGQTDLSLFSVCENIRNVHILGVTNLEPLEKFSALESVFIMSSGNDLSPLNKIAFSKLRLSGVTDKELNAIDGCVIDTLQISDKTISDLSVLERLPNLKVLFLTVSSGKNQAVTTFIEPTEEELDKLETSVDVSVLKEFLRNDGTLYLVDDPNR